jgi:hypothetical protein
MHPYEPIQLAHAVGSRHAYYANINGIARGSIGCYFDSAGLLVATTLDKGPKYAEMLAKIEEQIERRGVVMPEPGTQ